MSDEDPFENLEDEAEDREGDPFDRLDDPGPAENSSESDTDQFFPNAPGEETGTGDSSSRSDDAGTDRGDPLDPDASASGPAFDLDDDGIREPRIDSAVDREGDPFTEMDVDDVDPNEVWQELAGSGSGSGDAVSGTEGRTYAEVSKHSYCEQCEFFSDPPDITCAHEGTEIVEFLDMETVRVVDCPIVAERKEIREGDTGPE